MMNVAEINPLKLPSIALSSKNLLPSVPAIYFAIDTNDRIQYIGQTRSLNARWQAHHKKEALDSIDSVRIAWIEISDLALLLPVEQACIEYFNPALNRQMLKTEVRRDRPEIWKHDERKKAVQFMLTKTAVDEIDAVAQELGISRSEVIERAARSGGMRTARNYEMTNSREQ